MSPAPPPPDGAVAPAAAVSRFVAQRFLPYACGPAALRHITAGGPPGSAAALGATLAFPVNQWKNNFNRSMLPVVSCTETRWKLCC